MSHHTSGIFSQLFVFTLVYKDLIDFKFKMLFGYFALCLYLNALRKIALQWRHKKEGRIKLSASKANPLQCAFMMTNSVLNLWKNSNLNGDE